MPFWSSGQVEPKRQFRFTVIIGNMAEGATFYARSVTKPAFTITTSNHKFLNHTFYYPGKVEWNEVTISLVDPVDPDATGNILTILRKSGYNIPANLAEPGATSTIGKKSASEALGEVTIEALDEDGVALEKWKLNNPFITALAMNEYSYEGEDLSTVDVTLRYDWASYEIPAERTTPTGGPDFVDSRLFTL